MKLLLTLQVTADPSQGKISGQKCLLLRRPSVLQSSTAKAKLCDTVLQLEGLQSLRGNQQDDWQLIRGVRIQKCHNAKVLAKHKFLYFHAVAQMAQVVN